MNRIVVAVVAGGVGFYSVSNVFFEAGVNGGDVAVTLLAVSFALPALTAWLLYPGARTALRDSRIDHERLVTWLYYLGTFSMFFGVGTTAAYAVGTQVDFGAYLLAWTTVCGVVSGVGLSLLFWRD